MTTWFVWQTSDDMVCVADNDMVCVAGSDNIGLCG